MFQHSINAASFVSVLIAALTFSFSLAGVAAAQTGNTSLGIGALPNNTGSFNTAIGVQALISNSQGMGNTAVGVGALVNNTTGDANTAIGLDALNRNSTGSSNTAIGDNANVSDENLTNATAIGNGAIVDASNKIRLGNDQVTAIEGQVAFSSISDKTHKENFKPVNGEEVLRKIRDFELTSWNFIGHDPEKFRHYGPHAQEFFAAFGDDGVGQIGSETTINHGDLAGILMIAVQALEQRTRELQRKEARIAVLESRLEALELRNKQHIR
jgi:trimeric autotransporter adhesin